MTTQIKHSFTSAKADGADATLLRPSNWNAAHNPYLNKTNKSGAAVSQYDVVVSDASNNDAFLTTTTSGDTRPVFVVQDAAGIANNAAGSVLGAGWDTTVNVQGNVTRGNWLITSTTTGRAADPGVAGTSTPPKGAFACATSAYGGGGAGTVTAYMGVTGGPGIGAAKCLGLITGAGGVLTNLLGIASSVRNSVGDYTATWTTAFTSASHIVSVIPEASAIRIVDIVSKLAGSVNYRIVDAGGTLQDTDHTIIAFGNQ